MHEFSFCQGIVDALKTEWQEHNLGSQARLVEVKVVIGRLHQVIEENMQMAYSVLTRETFARDSRLTITYVDIRYQCNSCGHTGRVDPPLFTCSHCNTGDIRITAGKELYLEKLEVNQPDEDAGTDAIPTD